MNESITSAVSQLQKIEEQTEALARENPLLHDVFNSICGQVMGVRRDLEKSLVILSPNEEAVNNGGKANTENVVTNGHFERRSQWLELLQNPRSYKKGPRPLSVKEIELETVENIFKGCLCNSRIERTYLAILVELSQAPDRMMSVHGLEARIGYKASTISTSASAMRMYALENSNWKIKNTTNQSGYYIQLEEGPSIEAELLEKMNQNARVKINESVKAYWKREGYSPEGDPEKILGNSIWKLCDWIVRRVDGQMNGIFPGNDESRKALARCKSWKYVTRNIFETTDESECIRVTKNW